MSSAITGTSDVMASCSPIKMAAADLHNFLNRDVFFNIKNVPPININTPITISHNFTKYNLTAIIY